MSEAAIDICGNYVAGITRPILSVAPVSLPLQGRGAALQVCISAPLDEAALPVILFSHGNGQWLYVYGPLVNHLRLPAPDGHCSAELGTVRLDDR
jgi:hypothetical protein